MRTTVNTRGCLLAIVLLVPMLVLSAAQLNAAPPLSGAIFTTNADGTRVNQNIYQAKCDVYLDGGPGPNAPATAAGLPDGDYYFQVTDPSGKTLLSTDPVANRQFQVSGGFITALSGLGNHNIGVDTDQAAAGAITVQLCDFLDTPNRGGVYKVWVTRVEDFVGDPALVDDPCGRGCFHGFLPAASKTDNFKVTAGDLPCLEVRKWVELDGNGVLDSGEHFINGWPIMIFGPLGDQINGELFTTVDPGCIVFNLEPGLYRIVEAADHPGESPGDFTVTANIVDGQTLNDPQLEIFVRIHRNDSVRVVIFVNAETSWLMMSE